MSTPVATEVTGDTLPTVDLVPGGGTATMNTGRGPWFDIIEANKAVSTAEDRSISLAMLCFSLAPGVSATGGGGGGSNADEYWVWVGHRYFSTGSIEYRIDGRSKVLTICGEDVDLTQGNYVRITIAADGSCTVTQLPRVSVTATDLDLVEKVFYPE